MQEQHSILQLFPGDLSMDANVSLFKLVSDTNHDLLTSRHKYFKQSCYI